MPCARWLNKAGTAYTALKTKQLTRYGLGWGLSPDWPLAGFSRPIRSAGQDRAPCLPLALAFVAGYSVDLLFTAMDRLVAAFSGQIPGPADQSGSRLSQLPKSTK